MMRKYTKTMGEAIYFTCVLALFSHIILIAAYTLTPSQSISDGKTLISQGDKFELGFFSPSNASTNRYLGIWFKTIPVRTVVWVANRESPISNKSGVLKIDKTGNLVIVNGTEGIVWSSNTSKPVLNPIVEFLESGNLVFREERNTRSDSYLWQSFDYPGDTVIPGMKIGWELKTGRNRYLSSWRNSDDPSRGDFTYGYDPNIYPEITIRKESKLYYRGGPWNGIQNSGAPDLKPNSIFTYQVIQNAEESYFTYQLVNQSVIIRTVLLQNGDQGHIERSVWVDNSNSWSTLLSIPRDSCDSYALCGNYSSCGATNVALCQCLEGFKPKSPKDWSATDWTQGCEREVPLKCDNGEGFRKYTNVKLPDTSNSWIDRSSTLEECRVRCLNNCSCMAYTSSIITGGGSGCILWFTDLVDIKQFSSDGQDLHIRMPASELESEANSRRKKRVITIATIASVAGIILLGLGSSYAWKEKCSKGRTEQGDFELPLYSLASIIVATDNFSAENKLGEGGFGPVYKGKLEDGQEIAVKRLSKDSTQGVDAFKNEVILISKLQHRNLVKLLGCCIQKEEKMLVYEYMPNNSLNSSIFDETKRKLLDWKQRFKIIQGIAEGLHYLHHFSRLKIVHRDLKASNVLLDSEMAPKISDFGMARIFGGDQVEAKTKRVVGTYGYMSPEYVINGHFSAKSDVFSFGVLVLEIISGERNWGFNGADYELNLLGYAWKLWSEDRSAEFVDNFMSNSGVDQDVLRCIHIGLLCVQSETKQRPTMSSVVIMLGSEASALPSPQRPGFYMERSPLTTIPPCVGENPHSSAEFTMTVVEGR